MEKISLIFKNSNDYSRHDEIMTIVLRLIAIILFVVLLFFIIPSIRSGSFEGYSISSEPVKEGFENKDKYYNHIVTGISGIICILLYLSIIINWFLKLEMKGKILYGIGVGVTIYNMFTGGEPSNNTIISIIVYLITLVTFFYPFANEDYRYKILKLTKYALVFYLLYPSIIGFCENPSYATRQGITYIVALILIIGFFIVVGGGSDGGRFQIFDKLTKNTYSVDSLDELK